VRIGAHADRVHNFETATATSTPTSGASTVTDFAIRLALALLIPAMGLSWRHSKLVALAIAIPFAANIYVMRTGIDLPVEHPARVLVPAISAMLGFAEAYAEGRHGKTISRACVLGILAFALGIADIAALPTFAVLRGWYPIWMSILVSITMIAVSTVPQRRFPWLISSM
jgi:hypothetical protein